MTRRYTKQWREGTQNKSQTKLKKETRQADLNRRPLAQGIFGLPAWAICEFTIAGGKSRPNHFGPDSHGLPVQASQRSLYRHDAFVSHFPCTRKVSGERAHLPRIRHLFPLALKIPASLFSSPYQPRLRLSPYVGSENNRRYFLGLGK